MQARKKIRRRFAAVFTFALLVLLVFLLRSRMVPIVRDMAKTSVSNEASTAINRAVIQQIQDGEIVYDRMVLLEKDMNGNISAIKTNMAEINRLKSDILDSVDAEILEMSVSEISLPLGSLILPELFSGRGPHLPVRILSVSSSDASFFSTFSAAGINQTLHRILISVSATMTVLTPLGTQNVTTEAQIVAAETVIVGTVPQTYMDLGQ